MAAAIPCLRPRARPLMHACGPGRPALPLAPPASWAFNQQRINISRPGRACLAANGSDTGQPWRRPLAGQSSEEMEFVWAGYSDLSDQLRKAHAKNNALEQEVETLHAAVRRLQQQQQQQQQPPLPHQHPYSAAAADAWQAASFLLLFLVVINIAGLIASCHLAASSFTWFGWGFKQQVAAGSALARPLLSAVAASVPVANSLVVLVFCVQAVKAAWMCLKL